MEIVDGVLHTGRKSVGLRRRKRTVFVCDECDETFPTVADRTLIWASTQLLTPPGLTPEEIDPTTDGTAEAVVDGPTFTCGLCSRSFGSQNALNAHRRKDHAAGGDTA